MPLSQISRLLGLVNDLYHSQYDFVQDRLLGVSARGLGEFQAAPSPPRKQQQLQQYSQLPSLTPQCMHSSHRPGRSWSRSGYVSHARRIAPHVLIALNYRDHLRPRTTSSAPTNMTAQDHYRRHWCIRRPLILRATGPLLPALQASLVLAMLYAVCS